MHYYARHIGNYARDTGHLSALEHGVYALLLDWYYLNEKPLSFEQAVRVSRGNPVETQSVLSEFFKKTEQGWIHSYADREIEKYHSQAEKNRNNGKKGGRPKSAQVIDSIDEKTQWVSFGMPEQTLTQELNNSIKERSTYVDPSAEADLLGSVEVNNGNRVPNCPHADIIGLYHEILPELPEVRSWETRRQKYLAGRWKSAPERQSLDWWRMYFTAIRSMPFLMGKVQTYGDRQPFLADLEWLVKPNNFAKVIEGRYAR